MNHGTQLVLLIQEVVGLFFLEGIYEATCH